MEKVVIGDATLYRGCCLEVMQTLDKVDAVVTDPPYGINVEVMQNSKERWKSAPTVETGKCEWDKKRIIEFVPLVLRLSQQQVIFGGNYYADLLPPSRSWIVWDKLATGGFSDCELAWTSHNRGVRKFEWLWNGFRKQRPEERFHPTQKPIQLMKWVVKNYTRTNVFDPFMGSGTTGVAAVQEGRKFIGVEIDERYFQIACKRIEEAQKQLRLFT